MTRQEELARRAKIDEAASAAIDRWQDDFLEPLIHNMLLPNIAILEDPTIGFEIAARACEMLAIRLRKRAAKVRDEHYS